VTLKNLTYSQPISPLTVAYHKSNKEIFRVGSKATKSLEMLAESGDNKNILKDFSNPFGISSSVGGKKVILPNFKLGSI